MLETVHLSSTRGDRTLFSDVSFTLASGTLLRVTGANGSGKTTLLRITCGLVLPDSGEVLWRGRSIRDLREDYWKELVYIGHVNAVKDDLTALENLEMGAAVTGRRPARAAALAGLDRFGIGRCAALPARVLSQGQRRRVALARLTLSAELPLWILDEPFNALDMGAVSLMETLIGTHVASGGTVILTTHQEVGIEAPVEQRVEL